MGISDLDAINAVINLKRRARVAPFAFWETVLPSLPAVDSIAKVVDGVLRSVL